MSKRNQARQSSWRAGLFPGLGIIGLTILLRMIGGLQFHEWLVFDRFLKSRSPELIDERITIIGLNEADIARKGFPIPDSEVAKLLATIQQHQPSAVGLDLAKNLAKPELIAALKAHPNQFAVEKVLPSIIDPPPGLPEDQIGFVDISTDEDSCLRRVMLGTCINECENVEKDYKKSLVLRLAEKYFADRGIELENGKRDRYAMAFNEVELPRFFPNTGGYVDTNDPGQQTLINFRIGENRKPFRILSLEDIENNNFDPSWLKDRLVLIGMTAISANDIQNTAVTGSNSLSEGKIYGVEVIAHSISQILSAVEDDRPLIKTFSEPVEYLWIIFWGVAGIGIAWLPSRPWKNLLAVGATNVGLMGFCWLLLIHTGWWLPIVPTTLVCLLNGIALTPFYYRDRSLRSLLLERQKTIDLTYDSIHNGPLQTLKLLIRNTKDGKVTEAHSCLLYTSPSPRDLSTSRMPSSA